jgi:GT2 family glycosyltransferase
MFVVVLYKMKPQESPTVSSLLLQQSLLKERAIRLLILDNTPGTSPQEVALDDDRDYVSFGANNGLAGAYQLAYSRAQSSGHRFLVFLDQDSTVSGEFISALDGVSNLPGERVGIWCPRVVCGKVRISPFSLNWVGWPNYFPPADSDRCYGINSFSVVDVRCIEEIGGFDQFYWLDGLDFWLYQRAQETGWTVQQLDVIVNHDLSLVSHSISFDRLKNMAFYQSCFILEFGSPGHIVGTLVRLAARGLKRLDTIGGARNYGTYLCEVFKGVPAGLARRKRHAGQG